jgi:hypothetical protein
MPGYAGDLDGDLTNDCVVDIADLRAFAQTWLDSTRQSGTVLY